MNTIFYVNYTPYENAGHILDFILKKYDRVIMFSLGFHSLNNQKQLNKISIYEKGKLKKKIDLYYMDISEKFIYYFIPIRSTLNAFQIIYYIIKFNLEYGKISVFFSVNAFNTVIGMILQKIGLVGKSIFWVWDYYPLNHERLSVRIMRYIYWKFDKFATGADRVVYVNERLAKIRIREGILSKDTKYYLAPISTGEIKNKNLSKKKNKSLRIAFIGVLKLSQGLDFVIKASNDLKKHFGDVIIDVIGSGPDERYLKSLAKRSQVKTYFYGQVDDKKIYSLLKKSTLGIAPYSSEKSNVSIYSDPGKIKWYIDLDLPIITTNVFEFSKEISREKAGEIVIYNDTRSLVLAIKKILTNYDVYKKGVLKLHKKYYYMNTYKGMFDV
jgi:glycosyltransferase involved in cell wall biosynthesis